MRRVSRAQRARSSTLERFLCDYLGADGYYGIRVPSCSRDLRHIDLAFGFLAAQVYCCAQIRCNVDPYSAAWWTALRMAAAQSGVRLPRAKITIHTAVFIDSGAQFSVGGPAANVSMHESIWRESEST